MPRDKISLPKLADLLGVPLDRMPSLVAANYLFVLETGDTPETIFLARPEPEIIDWLQLMFGPVSLRPMIPLADVAHMLRLKLEMVQHACETLGVKVWPDPIFDGLISARGLLTLKRDLERLAKSTIRIDRQIQFSMLARLKGARPEEKRRQEPLPYNERLEEEIKRIARMKEPVRTFRAVELWNAYCDADKVTDCLKKGGVRIKEYEAKIGLHETMNRIEKILLGERRWNPDLEDVKVRERGYFWGPRGLTSRHRHSEGLKAWHARRKAAKEKFFSQSITERGDDAPENFDDKFPSR